MIINSSKTKINVENLKKNFLIIKDWEIRYKYIIQLGKFLIKMPNKMKNDNNLIKGCQNRVWCNLIFNKNIIYLYIDSDSLIIKGLISILFIHLNKTDIKEITLNFIKFKEFINNLNFFKNITLIKYYGFLYIEHFIKNEIKKYFHN